MIKTFDNKKVQYSIEGVFEGPLDIMLHLINKNKISIFDIKISELINEYLLFVQNMQEENMLVSSEILDMTSKLVYIKTISLLPSKEKEVEQFQEELVRDLVEYKLYKDISLELNQMLSEDTFVREAEKLNFSLVNLEYDKDISLDKLLKSLKEALGKQKLKAKATIDDFSHVVKTKFVSIELCAVCILRRVKKESFLSLTKLYEASTSVSEAVAIFLAVLSMIKTNRIELNDDNNLVLKRKESEFDETKIAQNDDFVTKMAV